MEANKENINRSKEKTRIPLPVQPLPAIPKHLLHTKNDNLHKEQRRIPLKTINSDNQAGSSRTLGKVVSNKHIPLSKHTKFVTIRQKSNIDLDWNYSVFKENITENEKIIITEVQENEGTKQEAQRNSHVGEENVGTPAPVLPPEPIRVKNLKRSLKRPHSRELQGLSPVPVDKSGDEKCKRRLKFNVNAQNVIKSPKYLKKLYTMSIERDYVDDMFSHLLSIEKPGVEPDLSTLNRACVLNWILKVNGPHGNPAVVQTAYWYLDSILNVCSVQTEQLNQVAAACYWISQKIYGSSLTASQLVRYSKEAFTSKDLMIVERAIMNHLKFPTQPVVPQEFISYLSWWCDNAHSDEIEIAATFICMCGLLVNKRLCTQLPSVIAVTCVHNALSALRKRHLIHNLQSCPIYKAIMKKEESICPVCIALQKAVHIMSQPAYKFNVAMQHFGMGPQSVVLKVVNYVKMLRLFDAQKTN